MKIGIITMLVLATASPALANPLPAGKCSLIDDGVRTLARPPQMDQSTSHDPNIISLAVPPVIGQRVVDVTFRINADGTVADPKVLCVSIPGSGIEAAISRASKNWRFSPMTQAGKPVVTEAAYRLSASGIIPLTFATEGLRKVG